MEFAWFTTVRLWVWWCAWRFVFCSTWNQKRWQHLTRKQTFQWIGWYFSQWVLSLLKTRAVNGAYTPLLHRFHLCLYYSLQVVGTSHHGMGFVSLVASYKQKHSEWPKHFHLLCKQKSNILKPLILHFQILWSFSAYMY